MLLYQLVITAALALLLLNTLLNLRWLRRPIPPHSSEGVPLVSILVPARNEARSIARCVESLARQAYPRYEILVLDDQSEDDTAAIVAAVAQRHPVVRLLHGQPLPTGWHGKAYACMQLAQAAHGEWLLFVDADTALAPDCVAVALRAAQVQQADLLTMLPRIRAASFGEVLLLPIILFAFGSLLPLGLVTRARWSWIAGALGPFLLFRREVYCRIGGHAAVRADIVEDMQLSRLVKRAGGRVVWIDGARLMDIRFYHSSAEAWRGLAKSTFTALNYSFTILAGGLMIVLALFVMPAIFLIIGVICYRFDVALFWLPLTQMLCLWGAQIALARRFHLSPLMALAFSATMVAVVACTAFAAYQSLFGKGVAWKGRTYQFRAHATMHSITATLARWLAVLRCALAGVIIVLGWRLGDRSLSIAAMLVLITWSIGLFEQTLRKRVESRWAGIADGAGAVAALGYSMLAGLPALWLVVLALLVTFASALWFDWRGMAATGVVACGSIVLTSAAVAWPALQTLILVWVLGVLLLERHMLTQNVGEWLHRLRSS